MSRQPPVEVPVEVPVGTILPYAGPINACTRRRLAAQGWLFCDGSTLRAVDYPELFAVIRRLYGWETQDAQHEGLFCLPDCRGVFLRGVNQSALRADGKTRRDPEADKRAPARGNGSGNHGNAVGSTQEDAFEQHEHKYYRLGASPGLPQACGEKPTLTSALQETELATGPTGPRTSTETRPINLAVNFIIKCRSRVRPAHDLVRWCKDTSDQAPNPSHPHQPTGEIP